MSLVSGNLRRALWDREGAPYILVLFLPLGLAAMGVLQGFATPDAEQPHSSAPFLVPLFLLPMLLLSQFCKMRPRAFGRLVTVVVQGLIVWVPFVLWMFVQGEALFDLEWTRSLITVSCISPLVHVAWATNVWKDSIELPPGGVILAVQGLYFLIFLGLAVAHWGILKKIAASGIRATSPASETSGPAAEVPAAEKDLDIPPEEMLRETTRIEPRREDSGA